MYADGFCACLPIIVGEHIVVRMVINATRVRVDEPIGFLNVDALAHVLVIYERIRHVGVGREKVRGAEAGEYFIVVRTAVQLECCRVQVETAIVEGYDKDAVLLERRRSRVRAVSTDEGAHFEVGIDSFKRMFFQASRRRRCPRL